nr:hypothetical protein [uncultured Campylobacter sp.]
MKWALRATRRKFANDRAREAKTKCRLANETLNAKAACGLNKLVNSDKSAQANDECASEF